MYSREEIHQMFQEKQYKRLYGECAAAINEMLMITTGEEFEDFLQQVGELEEDIFWLYHEYVCGKSMLIGGYEEDVTEKVRSFLKDRMSTSAFAMIEDDLRDVYVDLDGKNNLENKISLCNARLKDIKDTILLQYEDVYCAGAYFLSVNEK